MIKKIYISFISIFILATVTFFVAGSQDIYRYEFKKYNIENVTGIDEENLNLAIERLSGYVVGKYETLNHEIELNGEKRLIYNNREILHMKDVRDIFDKIKIFSSIYFLIIILMSFKYVKLGKFIEYLYTLSKYSILGSGIVLLSMLTLILTDFSAAFYKFHEIFFTNDLWLLNPETDIMIQMLPESFFMDLSIIIIVLSTFIQLGFYILMKIIKSKK